MQGASSFFEAKGSEGDRTEGIFWIGQKYNYRSVKSDEKLLISYATEIKTGGGTEQLIVQRLYVYPG